MEAPRRKQFRSDASSIQSSNTKKTSASQSTIKRGHIDVSPSKKTSLVSLKKSSSTQFSSPRQQETRKPAKKKQSQESVVSSAVGTIVKPHYTRNLETTQRKQTSKNASSPISPKGISPNSKSSPTIRQKSDQTKRDDPSNTGTNSFKLSKKIISNNDSQREDKIQKGTILNQNNTVFIAHNSNEDKDCVDYATLIAHPNNKEYPTEGEKMTNDSELDLHSSIDNCEWEKLYNQLKLLSTKRNFLSEISTMSKQDASVLHSCCWKAPAGLTLIIIKLVPSHGDKAKSIFLTQDKDGNTPLHLCAANMMPFYDERSSKSILDISVLEGLLNAAPEALLLRNKGGDTPLHLFVTSQAASLSTNLLLPPTLELRSTALKALTKILDSFITTDISEMKDNLGSTPFHSALTSPADESILSALLDRSPTFCKVEDEKGMIPLHYVAAFLDTPVSVVKKMISMYQFSLCHKTKVGDTPLHLLVRNLADDVNFDETKGSKNNLLDHNAIEILKILMGNAGLLSMEHGKDLNQENDPYFIKNNESLTPIHCCALFNVSIDICQTIMSHPSAERAALITNDFGATPLHLAAQNNNSTSRKLECIIDLNRKACEITDDFGNLPLHGAVQTKAKEQIVLSLVNAHPEAAKTTNNDLDTPLHIAVKYRCKIDVIKLLIHHNQNALTHQNQDGDVPLHFISSSEASPDVIELLLEASPHSASIQNNEGNCALHYLVCQKSISIAVLRLYLDIAESSLSIKNDKGQTPFDVAKIQGATRKVLQLLEKILHDK